MDCCSAMKQLDRWQTHTQTCTHSVASWTLNSMYVWTILRMPSCVGRTFCPCLLLHCLLFYVRRLCAVYSISIYACYFVCVLLLESHDNNSKLSATVEILHVWYQPTLKMCNSRQSAIGTRVSDFRLQNFTYFSATYNNSKRGCLYIGRQLSMSAFQRRL